MYPSMQGNKSSLCVTSNMAQKSEIGKTSLEIEFYSCLLFSYPFMDCGKRQKLEKGENALPSILLHVKMNLTACKEKSRDNREKSMVDSQGTCYPCEGFLFLTSLLIINCPSLSAASRY